MIRMKQLVAWGMSLILILGTGAGASTGTASSPVVTATGQNVTPGNYSAPNDTSISVSFAAVRSAAIATPIAQPAAITSAAIVGGSGATLNIPGKTPIIAATAANGYAVPAIGGSSNNQTMTYVIAGMGLLTIYQWWQQKSEADKLANAKKLVGGKIPDNYKLEVNGDLITEKDQNGSIVKAWKVVKEGPNGQAVAKLITEVKDGVTYQRMDPNDTKIQAQLAKMGINTDYLSGLNKNNIMLEMGPHGPTGDVFTLNSDDTMTQIVKTGVQLQGNQAATSSILYQDPTTGYYSTTVPPTAAQEYTLTGNIQNGILKTANGSQTEVDTITNGQIMQKAITNSADRSVTIQTPYGSGFVTTGKDIGTTKYTILDSNNPQNQIFKLQGDPSHTNTYTLGGPNNDTPQPYNGTGFVTGNITADYADGKATHFTETVQGLSGGGAGTISGTHSNDGSFSTSLTIGQATYPGTLLANNQVLFTAPGEQGNEATNPTFKNCPQGEIVSVNPSSTAGVPPSYSNIQDEYSYPTNPTAIPITNPANRQTTSNYYYYATVTNNITHETKRILFKNTTNGLVPMGEYTGPDQYGLPQSQPLSWNGFTS